MNKASIVYWYAGDELRPDGGGARAMAWARAIEQLGFDTQIVPLRTREVAVEGQGVGTLGRLKKALLPMPLDKKLPKIAEQSDLVVATVPAVFRSALRSSASDRLIFDWMDLWSVSSRTIGDARQSSIAGGRIQARIWNRREAAYPSLVGSNTIAGYSEYEAMLQGSSRPMRWLPNPVTYRPVAHTAGSVGVTRLGFIGNFYYGPNVYSLRDFLTRHSALLSNPKFEIVVAGYGSEITKTWGFPITVMGPVDEVAEFYGNIDAAVVPITHGSGIKIKAIEALAHGVPVFGTAHVRDGLPREMRKFVIDLGRLGTDLSRYPRVPRREFESVFGFEAFRKTVSAAVSDLRLESCAR
ncbi:glycosyltransferase family 4 protein [Nocardioides sp. LS1]|uniref:glycosyltransferase n=1 Tax=Nocardioides sp. LS1 TaxID=1027620 RepID=UPI000F6160CD|nr:glycosyltransferase family 4 protein [Nocardioides sp. LS1]GCD90657.1 hypothetical protein NLS1_26630 [Nocardioides sp. LS1]